MEGEFGKARFGTKDSSFEQLLPGISSNQPLMPLRRNSSEDTRSMDLSGSTLTRPKACRPLASAHARPHEDGERSRSSDDDRQEGSPIKAHSKSAWTRVGRQTPTSSPDREVGAQKPLHLQADFGNHEQLKQARPGRSPHQEQAYALSTSYPQYAQPQPSPNTFFKQAAPPQPRRGSPDARGVGHRGSQELQPAARRGNIQPMSARRSSQEIRPEAWHEPQRPLRQPESHGRDNFGPPAVPSLASLSAAQRQAWSQREREDSDRTQSSQDVAHSGEPDSYRRPIEQRTHDLKYEEVSAPRRVDRSKANHSGLPNDFRPVAETRPERERGTTKPSPNGTLSMLRDAESEEPAGPRSSPYVLPSRPPNAPQNPAQEHQLYKLFEEVLRNQPQGAAQLAMHAPEGALPPAGPLTSLPPYTSLTSRLNPLDAYRQYSQPPELDAFPKLNTHRWTPPATLGPENLLQYPMGPSVTQILQNMPTNLSSAEHQALFQALQQKHQAQEAAAVADITIQAILSGSVNREAAIHSMRKKRPSEAAFLEQQPSKRHSSLMSEGELYSNFSNEQQQIQICADCGTTQTPTWRRSGKRLMCNACGLRRSRSMKSRTTQRTHSVANLPVQDELVRTNMPPHLSLGPNGNHSLPQFHRPMPSEQLRPRPYSPTTSQRLREEDPKSQSHHN